MAKAIKGKEELLQESSLPKGLLFWHFGEVEYKIIKEEKFSDQGVRLSKENKGEYYLQERLSR